MKSLLLITLVSLSLLACASGVGVGYNGAYVYSPPRQSYSVGNPYYPQYQPPVVIAPQPQIYVRPQSRYFTYDRFYGERRHHGHHERHHGHH